MLTILGAVAEMERELTVERVREGIRKAQQYGTRSGKPIGRPPRKIPASFKKYYEMWKSEEISGVEVARLLDISRPTLYRYVREHEKDECQRFGLSPARWFKGLSGCQLSSY